MWQQRIKAWLDAIRARLARRGERTTSSDAEEYESRYEATVVGPRGGFDLRRSALPLTIGAIAVLSAVALVMHPPVQGVGRGEVGVRINHVTGAVSEWNEGSVFVLPGLQRMRVFSLRDQSWRAAQMSRADGPAPLQSVEGLSLGADLTVRYAIDPLKVAALAKSLPDDVGAEIVEPAAQGVIYKVFARYTVREIFSTKRSEIQAAVENELKPRLAADGVVLRHVQIGKIDLPADYRRGMESLLAEELAGEKMKYTLDLKEKQVKETELTAKSEKVRREIGAEAAAREQVIAAKGQEEAMKHVLPFKQRQIEQRQLEAEAQKVTRIKAAEASAQARRIEANGEADGAPEARRRRGLSPRQGRQVERRADGPRRRAHHAPPAADPEDDGRQALRQGAGDHRRARHRRQLHRRRPARQRASATRSRAAATTPSSTRPRSTRRRHREHRRHDARRRPHRRDAADRGVRRGAGDGRRGGELARRRERPPRRLASPPTRRPAPPRPPLPRPPRPRRAWRSSCATRPRCAPRRATRRRSRPCSGKARSLEVRGERLDYLQVWDHVRERGGFVRASQVHRSRLGAADAPGLLTLIAFTRQSSGHEALGIGLTAAYLQAAPAEALRGAAGVEAFDALGTFADRLAHRVSAGNSASKAAEAALAAHLEVASALRRPLRELRARRQDADLLRRRRVPAHPRRARPSRCSRRAPSWR